MVPPTADTAALIGHRGAAGHAPENTLASLLAAARAGVTWVEFDVRLTGCGRLVLMHDADLDRTTNGTGRVADTYLDVLSRLDAGSWFGSEFARERVPLLEDALALLDRQGLSANIEIKAEPEDADEVVAVLVEVLGRRAAGAADLACNGQQVLLSSAEPAAVAALSDRVPGCPRALVLCEPGPEGFALARELGCGHVHIQYDRVTPPLLEELRRVIPEVVIAAFTVNDAAHARQLLDSGVASVFTDDPDMFAGSLPPDQRRTTRPPEPPVRERRRPPAA